MKPVDMTIIHDPENGAIGDCFRCCIASLLSLPASEVPHFCDYDWNDPDGGKWFRHLNEWLKPKGLCYVELAIPPNGLWDWDEWASAGFSPYYVMSGQSPRARHSVVAHKGEVVHDPHPSRVGLVGPYADGDQAGNYSYGFIVLHCDSPADLVAQPGAAEVREIVSLLSAADCPICDGSGSFPRELPHNQIEQVQCQWCNERAALLAKLADRKGDGRE